MNILVNNLYEEYNEQLEEQTYYIGSDCYTSSEEIWMSEVYNIITHSIPSQPKDIYLNNKQLVGISFPKQFISEVLQFKNINNFKNQFRLHYLLNIFNGDDEYIPLNLLNKERKKYPISGDFEKFFQKYKTIIYESLIQKYIYEFLVFYSFENELHIDLDEIPNLVQNIKKIYNNPIDSSNYSFPLTDKDITDYVSNIEKILDEDDEQKYFTELRNETLKFIDKMIKPLINIDINYLFDMAIDYSVYDGFLKKSNMEVGLFNDFFINELYYKVSKQSKMSLFNYGHQKIKLYFISLESEKKSNFKCLYENIPFQEEMEQIAYLEYFRSNQIECKYSPKFIGDKYEKFCKVWLVNNGYREVTIIGKTGDKGIDIIALNLNNKRIGIQCKYKAIGQVASKDIRLLDVDLIKKYYTEIDETMIILNCSLSREAVKEMQKLNVLGLILPYSLENYNV